MLYAACTVWNHFRNFKFIFLRWNMYRSIEHRVRSIKGNTVVVMNRNEYNSKMLEFIEANRGRKIDFDFNKFCQDVRASIKSDFIGREKNNSIRLWIPYHSRLYGLPKLHKDSVLIRPVVSFINAPTYNFCSFLDSWF